MVPRRQQAASRRPQPQAAAAGRRPQTRAPAEPRPSFLQPRSAVAQAAGVYDLEIGSGQILDLVELVVIPATVWHAGDIPGGAVVGQDHAVALEGSQNDLGVRPEARDVDRSLEPDAKAHRRQG